MNDNDFMNQPSGVFCGEWELTNAGLSLLGQLGLKRKITKSQNKKKKTKKRKKAVQDDTH